MKINVMSVMVDDQAKALRFYTEDARLREEERDRARPSTSVATESGWPTRRSSGSTSKADLTNKSVQPSLRRTVDSGPNPSPTLRMPCFT